LGITLLMVASTLGTAVLVAAGRSASQPALGPELLLLAVFFAAWVLRAAGHALAGSLLMASALLAVGIAFAIVFGNAAGIVFLPIVAFVIVLPHLGGLPLGAFGMVCVAGAGLITGLQRVGVRPDASLEVPLLVANTLGLAALVILAIWAVYRRAQSLGSEYADLVTHLPAGVVRFASNGEALATNPAFDALFSGAARQAILALLLEASAGTAGSDGTIAGMVELQDDGRRRLIGHRTRRYDQGRAGVVFDSAVVDVTPQMEAARQATLLSALGEATSDPILITSPDGEIQWSNTAAAALFESDPAKLLGRQIERLPSMTDVDRQVFRRAVSGQRSFEPVRISVGGEERFYSLSAVVIQDDAGRPAAVAFAGRDVTVAQREARRQGEHEAQLLDALKIEALTRVIASAADDVERLTATAERLDTGDASHAALLELVRAAEAARSLSAYTRSRTDSGTAVLDEVISRSERVLRQLVPRRILLEVQLDAPLSVTLSGTEVEEILATLVVNAVEAIEGSGHIWIKTFTERPGPGEGPWAVVEVGDTGSGMQPDVMARAFEPYFTTKGPAIGAGLGLSSVLRLVRDGGGKIDVQSQMGQGTVFRVRLKVAAGDARSLGPGARSR
jgi:PAS domain S-box-containing protein